MTAQATRGGGGNCWRRSRCVAAFLHVAHNLPHLLWEFSVSSSLLGVGSSAVPELRLSRCVAWTAVAFSCFFSFSISSAASFTFRSPTPFCQKLSQLKLSNFAGTRRTHRFNFVCLDWIKWIYHIHAAGETCLKIQAHTHAQLNCINTYIKYIYIYVFGRLLITQFFSAITYCECRGKKVLFLSLCYVSCTKHFQSSRPLPEGNW